MCIIAAPVIAGATAAEAAAAASAAMMANIALATGALSAGMGAYGMIQQGQAQAAASDYQAKVAENNAITASRNATYAKQSGAAAEQQSDMKTAAVIGATKASEASNGFDLNTGSNLDLQAGTAMAGASNAQTIRSNAAWHAYGFQTQGGNFTAQAGLDRTQGDNAMTAGMVGAGGSIIGGASALAGNAYKFGTSGMKW